MDSTQVPGLNMDHQDYKHHDLWTISQAPLLLAVLGIECSALPVLDKWPAVDLWPQTFPF